MNYEHVFRIGSAKIETSPRISLGVKSRLLSYRQQELWRYNNDTPVKIYDCTKGDQTPDKAKRFESNYILPNLYR